MVSSSFSILSQREIWQTSSCGLTQYQIKKKYPFYKTNNDLCVPFLKRYICCYYYDHLEYERLSVIIFDWKNTQQRIIDFSLPPIESCNDLFFHTFSKNLKIHFPTKSNEVLKLYIFNTNQDENFENRIIVEDSNSLINYLQNIEKYIFSLYIYVFRSQIRNDK